MVNQESSAMRAIAGFGRFLIGAAALLVILGIGYFTLLPKIQEMYKSSGAAAPAATQPPAPTADTSALKALQAQLTSLEAQLKSSQAAPVVQDVPKGEAPQTVDTSGGPPASGDTPPAGDDQPASRPIIIVQHEGYSQPVITGSGACAVARGARRCGK